MRFKSIILDFDGTLVESVDIKDRAFKNLFQDYPEHLDEIMQYHLSHNATMRFEKFKYIIENILGKKYNKDIEKNLSERFSKFTFRQIVEAPYVTGAEDFLNYFYTKAPLYLISTSPEQELNEIIKLRGLEKYFKKVYAVPWIKKDAIEDILSNEQISPQRAVFIGDSPEDFQAAKITNIFFIARNSNKAFRNPGISIYNNFIEIKAFIEKIVE